MSYLLLIFLTTTTIQSGLGTYITTCEPVISENGLIVKIPNYGTFEGSITSSLVQKRPIYQYLGIPYAIPPLGPWRFKVSIDTEAYTDNIHVNFSNIVLMFSPRYRGEASILMKYTMQKDSNEDVPKLSRTKMRNI